jgi:DNA replication and repair protein RecF
VLLERLQIADFRNLEAVSLAPSPHATVVVGANGQGKTSLLEALYFLCTLRPLRANRLSELVRFGTEQSAVSGRFTLGGAEREISVQIAAGLRQAFVDGKKAAKLEDYFGGVSVVAFTPDDLAVVKGGPELRRAFLDRAVFNRFPAYLREHRAYQRALKSRNRLLKENAPASYVEAYDEAVARTGARVLVRRRELLDELGPRAVSAVRAISQLPDVGVSYTALHLGAHHPRTEEGLEKALLHALAERLGRDRERGFTSVGPHADDLQLTLGGRSARAYASQGQGRALVLGWKIAEIENVRAAFGRPPLLLLDDVSSELDPDRNAFLMHTVAESRAQVLLTTTDATLVARAAGPDTLWLRVDAGTVTEDARLRPARTG